eukprot:5380069-Pyramimonas_sp.AAC.1
MGGFPAIAAPHLGLVSLAQSSARSSRQKLHNRENIASEPTALSPDGFLGTRRRGTKRICHGQ